MKEREGENDSLGPLQPGDEYSIVAGVEEFLCTPSPTDYVTERNTRFFSEEAPDSQQRDAADTALLHLDDTIVSPLLAQGHPVTADTIRAFYTHVLLRSKTALSESSQAGLRWQFSLPAPTHLVGAAKRRLAYYEGLKQQRPFPHLEEYIRPLQAIVTALKTVLPPHGSIPLDARLIGTEPKTEWQRQNVNYFLGSLYYRVADENPALPLRHTNPVYVYPAPLDVSPLSLENPRLSPSPLRVNHAKAAYEGYILLSAQTASGEQFTLAHLLWGAEQQRKKFQELTTLLQTNDFDLLITRYDMLCDVLEQAILTEANQPSSSSL